MEFADHKFRQYGALVLLIGGRNTGSINLSVIADQLTIAVAVPNLNTEEIHVERIT